MILIFKRELQDRTMKAIFLTFLLFWDILYIPKSKNSHLTVCINYILEKRTHGKLFERESLKPLRELFYLMNANFFNFLIRRHSLYSYITEVDLAQSNIHFRAN